MITREVGSDFSFPLGAIYMLLLEAGHKNPIRNYTKVMVRESDGGRFGTSLTSTFDIDGNGEDRVWGAD